MSIAIGTKVNIIKTDWAGKIATVVDDNTGRDPEVEPRDREMLELVFGKGVIIVQLDDDATEAGLGVLMAGEYTII